MEVGERMTATTVIAGRPKRRGIRKGRVALHAFLITMSVIWIFPLAWTFLHALAAAGRHDHPRLPVLADDPEPPELHRRLEQADLPYYFFNTLIVAVPSVILVLLIASVVAFALTRVRSRINLFLLMMFTAGNLLPPQVIIVPLYYIYTGDPAPQAVQRQQPAVRPVHRDHPDPRRLPAGFCVFVLSNYMRTLPRELNEAALVDGASVFRTFRSIIFPLCAPALAALATLEFTFIYNDFFWALLLIKTGSKRPITSALNNLRGEFFTNYNVLAAAALMVAIPTIVVYILLQRQFIRGLTLGSTKG